MKDLIIIGGAKGVGKSSISKIISEEYDLKYIHTGTKAVEYKGSFNDKFFKDLMNLHQNILLDTHYVVGKDRDSYYFTMGLLPNTLKEIRSSGLYKGKVILIDADTETILERRILDSQSRRSLDMTQILLERSLSHHFANVYSECLNFKKYVLKNDNMTAEEAAENLKKLAFY